MTRRLRPDLRLVEACLPPEARAAVAVIEAAFGWPAGAWRRVPPLRDLVVGVALEALVRDMPRLGVREATEAACEILGLADDDPDRNTRASDSMSRKIRLWRGQAARKTVSHHPSAGRTTLAHTPRGERT